MAKKKNEEIKHNAKRVPFVRDLSCALSREEVEERAQEAAAVLERRDQKEQDFALEKKRWKNELDKMDAEHRILSAEVRSKTTTRAVECERVFDYDVGKVVETRCDTGEWIYTRNMADSERQKDLDLGDDFDE